MARKLPRKDVVIIGLGWTGSIMAHELTDEGLDVIAIERGPWRDAPTEFPPNYMQDELRYRIRHELFLRPEQTTFTFRNKMDQTALPIRTWGAFMPPNGVGGGGVHWNAETWRFLPSDFVLKTHLTQRYGAAFLPEGMTIQDWGVTYDELEPHYDAFEYLSGTSGTAGNLRPDPGGRQSVRGAALAALSQSRAGAAIQLHAVRAGGARARLQAVSAAVGKHVEGLHQSARPAARTVHLLRILRVVRMRQLFQGQPADHDPAGAHPQVELRRAG
jgi:choline dehydrogenase-like flavoprotein